MRVYFVSPYSLRTVTGIGTFITGLAKEFRKKGMTPVAIAPSVPEKDAIDSQFEKSDYWEIRYIDRKGLRLISLLKFSMREIIRHRKEIDVLHLQQAVPLSAGAAILGRILGKKVVTTIHLKNPEPDNRLIRWIFSISEKITLKCSDRVTYVSKATRATLPVPDGIVIENGVDTEILKRDIAIRNDARKRLKIEDDFVAFIFASRWAEDKGIFDLLDAFSQINSGLRKRSRLLLTGGGNEESVMKNLLALKIKDETIVLGKVSQEDLVRCLNASDVFLLPSKWEGMPFSLLEAMSYGLVPIASSVGGNPEVVDDGTNGFLIEPKDITELAERMAWCIKNKEKLENIGKKARDTIIYKFDIGNKAEKYARLYAELTAEKA